MLSILCGLIAAAIGVYSYNTLIKLVPIVVAAEDIQPNQLITSKAITISKTPRGALLNDSIQNVEELRNSSAKGFIPAGTPLRKSMFLPLAQSSHSARLAALGEGYIALAVEKQMGTEIGGTVRAGDYVTIKAASKDATVETLIERAFVLDIPQKDKNIDSIVLAIPPVEADRIAQAEAGGKTIYFELLPKAGV